MSLVSYLVSFTNPSSSDLTVLQSLDFSTFTFLIYFRLTVLETTYSNNFSKFYLQPKFLSYI